MEKIKFILTILSLFVFSCGSNQTVKQKSIISHSSQFKIGFGSCLDQKKPMPILNSIKSEDFNLFLMLGDNIYGSSKNGDLKKLESAYKIQKKNFKKLGFNPTFEAIWDDHDYGLNDAGKEYAYKEDAKELFLDFWNIPMDDVRRSRDGLYFEWIQTIDGITVQMLFLDTRFFRDALLPTDERGAPGKERYLPHTDTSLTMLGVDQWNWLEEKMNIQVDHRIIVSSIQFLAMGHGWEAWKTLPHERQKLIDIIDQSSSENVLILSGDRHRAGLYQLTTNSNKNIIEMTSSSLNLSFANDEEAGPLRVGPTFVQENYGEILLNKASNSLIVNLKDNQGKIIQTSDI